MVLVEHDKILSLPKRVTGVLYGKSFLKHYPVHDGTRRKGTPVRTAWIVCKIETERLQSVFPMDRVRISPHRSDTDIRSVVRTALGKKN